MNGYQEGPTLPHDVEPWPLMWEQSVDETCAHKWQRCLLLAGQQRYAEEYVVRCAHCHVPRCGHSDDADPCMERRHHDGMHIRLSGTFEPLGGLPDQFIEWEKP